VNNIDQSEVLEMKLVGSLVLILFQIALVTGGTGRDVDAAPRIEGNRMYVDKKEPFTQFVFGLIDPEERRLKQEGKSPYKALQDQDALKQFLFLADDDAMLDPPLAEAVLTKVSSSTLIYKTDLYLSEGTSENFITKKLDNRNKFGFKDNQFDIVVMRWGICHCTGLFETCGGIDLKLTNRSTHSTINPITVQFFDEVFRVLNKTNPKAIAFLHGLHVGTEAYPDNPEIESRAAMVLDQIINILKPFYPNLDIHILYAEIDDLLVGTHDMKEEGKFEFLGVVAQVKPWVNWVKSPRWELPLDPIAVPLLIPSSPSGPVQADSADSWFPSFKA